MTTDSSPAHEALAPVIPLQDIRGILQRAANDVAALIPDDELVGKVTIAGITYRRHAIVLAMLRYEIDVDLLIAINLRWLSVLKKPGHGGE